MRNRNHTAAGRRPRPRPTLSLIISLFALVIAMSTTAYATTIAAKNSVISKSIKNGEVKTKDLADAAVSEVKLKDAAVTEAKLKDSSVGSATIRDGQVESRDLSAAAKADLSRGGAGYSTHFEEGKAVPTTMTTMATLMLPAGSYVLASKAQIDTYNNGDIILCELVAGSLKDRSYVQGSGGGAHESQIIGNSLVAAFAAAGTASLQCQTVGAGSISQLRLTAFSVSSVTNQP